MNGEQHACSLSWQHSASEIDTNSHQRSRVSQDTGELSVGELPMRPSSATMEPLSTHPVDTPPHQLSQKEHTMDPFLGQITSFGFPSRNAAPTRPADDPHEEEIDILSISFDIMQS